MLSEGNGHPAVCVLNLVRTFRGEVPYVRTKGVDRELIDTPATDAWRLRADAEWVVRSYEPRATLDEVRTSGGEAAGDLNELLGITQGR